MKTYNFKEFMNGTHEEKKSFSILPAPTASMFLNEPVFVLLGIGVVIIGLALWEKHLVRQGRDYEAEIVSLITGIGLPTIAIGGALYVVLRAGQLFL